MSLFPKQNLVCPVPPSVWDWPQQSELCVFTAAKDHSSSPVSDFQATSAQRRLCDCHVSPRSPPPPHWLLPCVSWECALGTAPLILGSTGASSGFVTDVTGQPGDCGEHLRGWQRRGMYCPSLPWLSPSWLPVFPLEKGVLTPLAQPTVFGKEPKPRDGPEGT